MNNYFDLRGSRRLSLLCDFVHEVVHYDYNNNCNGDGNKKDNGSDGDNRNYKYDSFLQSCIIPGKLQSGLLEQSEEELPQQTSHLHQEQVARHGNHDQQSSSLLHNPDAGGARRQ